MHFFQFQNSTEQGETGVEKLYDWTMSPWDTMHFWPISWLPLRGNTFLEFTSSQSISQFGLPSNRMLWLSFICHSENGVTSTGNLKSPKCGITSEKLLGEPLYWISTRSCSTMFEITLSSVWFHSIHMGSKKESQSYRTCLRASNLVGQVKSSEGIPQCDVETSRNVVMTVITNIPRAVSTGHCAAAVEDLRVWLLAHPQKWRSTARTEAPPRASYVLLRVCEPARGAADAARRAAEQAHKSDGGRGFRSGARWACAVWPAEPAALRLACAELLRDQAESRHAARAVPLGHPLHLHPEPAQPEGLGRVFRHQVPRPRGVHVRSQENGGGAHG